MMLAPPRATLAPIRLTNAATLFLPVLPTPLRGYCYAVRQNERQLLLRSQARCKEKGRHYISLFDWLILGNLAPARG